jgi:hypothetical protein
MGPKTQGQMVCLECPSATCGFHPCKIPGALELVNISKRKAEACSSFTSLCSCNLASKSRWKEASCSDLIFDSSY